MPGFWLGAWAWDDVAAVLRTDGHDVTALTLPGLESADTDRSKITLSDHVDAICDAIEAAGQPVVLAVHSGAGVSGYAASERLPGQIAAMIYIDSAPATGAINPGFHAVEMPLPPWEELADDGIRLMSDEHQEIFRQRAIPEPGAAVREAPVLTNERRRGVRSIVVCTSNTSEEMKSMIDKGYPWLAGLAELRDVSYEDLPTHHWPMWSRPVELAAIIGAAAHRGS
ncbi:alpha/beta fold hydrolase [Paenibacillus pinihumi]|uniref:alpha/beta fold hydrolase n=1 Tax=Paenibacillus pinihumi TaxID=669462 RepID=UPI001B7FD7E4|nr:alpha/beta fold hydrolase [Paenibacillus pinihumi]